MCYTAMSEIHSSAITAKQNVLKTFKDIDLPTLPTVQGRQEIKVSLYFITFLALKVSQLSTVHIPLLIYY